ncbi:MAG: bifunctional metallophosphatase/5'-nucleotidase [Lachnospiraceae bacterium]|nr:bifunctional metallophosphatase/5'-nucleotidase [Lachnospiraceae bacterium]
MIIILYTNDIHCGIEENIGYAGLAAYKKEAEARTPYVTLVDCGDAIQGDFVGRVSGGSYIIDIMNEVGYDFVAIGNHEFDYGMEQLRKLIEKSNAEFLGCNITYTGHGKSAIEAVKPYKIVQYGEISVAFIGVSTPNSIATSTPAFFMENDVYVYDFADENDGQELYDCVQRYVDECEYKGADYVVVLSHLGDNEGAGPFTSLDLIHATKGIDVVLDAHSHSVLEKQIVKNRDGQDVILSSAGTKFSHIGEVVIEEDGSISTRLISDYTAKDERVQACIDSIKATYEAEMKKVIAVSEVALSCYSEDGIRLVRSRETAIGDFCADAYRAIGKADIAFVNGGGIRANIPAGEITYADLFAVHPFGNTLCVVKAKGQEILDCLEMSSKDVMREYAENGNAVGEGDVFFQVSGLKYTVDTSVKSSVVLDENEMFMSVAGARRVKDARVLNKAGEYEPIVPDAVYTLAALDYIVKEGGGGFNMFMGNELRIDEGMTDYHILTTYVRDILHGKIGAKYAKAEGRIMVL